MQAKQSIARACHAIFQMMSTSLGPKGKDKLVQDELGTTHVSNDGAFILKMLHIQHPVARMLKDLAQSQEGKAGDGTTSTILFCCALVQNMQNLQQVQNNLHYSHLFKAMNYGKQLCLQWLQNACQYLAAKNSDAVLLQVAETTLHSKCVRNERGKFAQLALQTIQACKQQSWKNCVQFVAHSGGNLQACQMVPGLLVSYQQVLGDNTTLEMGKYRICLLDMSQFVFHHKYESKSQGLARENPWLSFLTKNSIQVVFCTAATVSFIASTQLSTIVVEKDELLSLADKLNMPVLQSAVDDENDASWAYKELKMGKFLNDHVQIESLDHVSLLLSAPTSSQVQEVQQSMEDALSVIQHTMNGYVIPGGGSVEVKLHNMLMQHIQNNAAIIPCNTIILREFAEALLVIPKCLIASIGSAQQQQYVKMGQLISENQIHKDQYMGINVMNGQVQDMHACHVLESFQAKQSMIHLAVDTCCTMLRIDQVIFCNNS